MIKKIVMFLSLLAVLFTITICAARAEEAKKKDFDLSIKGVYTVYQDRDLQKDGTGIKGELRWKYVYLWGGWERTEMRLTGQRAGELSLYGFGLGSKIELVKGLSIFGEVGYYIPNSDLANDPMKYSEGIYYKWVKLAADTGCPDPTATAQKYNSYTYELNSGIGGSLGLEFRQEIYKELFLGLFGMYRFLNLREDWDARDLRPTNQYPNAWLQTKEKRSFSGGVFGIGLDYRF